MSQLNASLKRLTPLEQLAYRNRNRLQSSLLSAGSVNMNQVTHDGTISSIHQQESSELSSPSGQSTQGLRPNTSDIQRTPPRDPSVNLDQLPEHVSEAAPDAPVETTPAPGISPTSTGSRFARRFKLFQSQVISDATSEATPKPDL
jgi:hypothetical protein